MGKTSISYIWRGRGELHSKTGNLQVLHIVINPLDIDKFLFLLCISFLFFSINYTCYPHLLPASSLLATQLPLPSISSPTTINDTTAECHREEMGRAVFLHSQGCKSEDAAAQLQGPHRYSGEGGREGEEPAPLCVQDSSTATSCLEPWCRIANDHTHRSHSYF